MIKIKLCIFLLIFASAITIAASIEDTIIMCNDCHGAKGISSDSDIPSIGGYSEATITAMFDVYLDEGRIARKSKFRHGDTQRPETDMLLIARELSEEDIEVLATYYSEQTFIPAKQNFDIALAKTGEKLHEDRCTKCHEDGGTSADDDSGILAGQWKPFLAQSFKDYRAGTRKTEEGMLKKINQLSEEQINALLHYYASQQ
ncbi:hypothetical protein A3Q34_01950 [Colwellia sp. PAMC 20917]|uniref:c-type cytochrome n=1 Tax=Colwellia sp. PAMC 20917 TaxID=1816218 RepID=UPI0008783E52|nr:c-type cytochrome [Colwellia sp. PAMC 20917]AOW75731.1 hypothetical protein A3Q34_01950 [Colwellia sp. PAMC 20917]